ncbi:hypothetical protein NXZ34_26995, partial [Escherichia coli]|nr:hypothetical protein [Escherichia coli]MDE7981759.1 hypothetical protein [Escherichia coli]
PHFRFWMTFVFSPAPGAFFPGDAPAWLSDMHFLREDNAAHSSLRIPLYSITDWHRSPISDSHPFDQPGT